MLVNKNLIPFLQFREQILDISMLEDKYGVILPPIYRSFICTFHPFFAHIKLKNTEEKNAEQNEFKNFVSVIYTQEDKEHYTIDDDTLCLDNFLEPEEVLEFTQRPYNAWQGDVLFIGQHGYWGGLMLGIGEENADKIYHYDSSAEMKYMAENIFVLIQKMQIVKSSFAPNNLNVDQLYKNWGEDFWRIKN